MVESSRHDDWQLGNSYDAYMGRWSRRIAPRFLDWLNAAPDCDWLDVGCGTGALSAAILERCQPRRLTAIDPSPSFITSARASLTNPRLTFEVGDAQALPAQAASQDVVVSGLVLNFLPDPVKALTEMKRVARPGGRIGIYVWDYPGRGIEFVSAFWNAATALDPAAADLSEDRRFPICTAEGLAGLCEQAGLGPVTSTAIAAPTAFADFADYWLPFTLGAGPAPGYCASLTPEARQRLKTRLESNLPRQPDGSIHLNAKAWAIAATT